MCSMLFYQNKVLTANLPGIVGVCSKIKFLILSTLIEIKSDLKEKNVKGTDG